MSEAIAAPRPAATVVVIRERKGNAAFDVLMVRRHHAVAFMAGAYVFPGGRVDPADHGGESDPTRAFRTAAVREVAEEADLRLDPELLVWFAHWITPESEPRRYDTRFFLAQVDREARGRPDERETTDLVWWTPDEALARCRQGEALLPPPTWTTLRRLQRYRTATEVLAWARALHAIPAVQPRLVKGEHGSVLTLPGDPTFPTIDGWEVPEETRFELRDGRWTATRPT